MAEQARWYRRQVAYGRRFRVEAGPVREHVRRLQACGLGLRRIAVLSGLRPSTVCRLVYGDKVRGLEPPRWVRTRTAQALQAVEAAPELVADGVQVDATGTRRRLQALAAIGWPQTELLKRLGLSDANGSILLRTRLVRAGTARAVRELYEQLWHTPAPQCTRYERMVATRVRRHAARQGWPPPMAWDDDQLDDPNATPRTADTKPTGRAEVDEIAVERALAGRPVGRPLNELERVALAGRLLVRGQGATQLARLLACNGSVARRLVNAAARRQQDLEGAS